MSEQISRRGFIKLVAATGAGVSVPGCKPAVRQLIPYVIPDENVIPGVPSFYATTCTECPAGCGVVARVREGRVIKLEGNPSDPVSGGAICARGQAGLEGLYNPDRLQRPQRRAPDGRLAAVDWESASADLLSKLQAAAARGADRVAYIGEPPGPTMGKIIDSWLQSWNSSRKLFYQALSNEPAAAAAQYCFGRQDLPVYRIDRAEVLISFGADFIETWNSPVEYGRQFAAFRQLRERNGQQTMGRAVYVGPRFSLTAANCDEWLAVRPGAEALIALAIIHVILDQNLARNTTLPLAAIKSWVAAYDPDSVAARTGVEAIKIQRLGVDFGRADGALALTESGDPNLHIAAFVLNALTGNVGRTMMFLEGAVPPPAAKRDEITAMIAAMGNGDIDVLVVSRANPAFAMPSAARFAEAARRVPFIVWCGGVSDETAELAHLQLPIHHPLEDWGDAAPRANVIALGQPVMQPVFESRPLGDILLASTRASSNPKRPPWSDTHAALLDTWQALSGRYGKGQSFEEFWYRVREAGGLFLEPAPAPVTLRPAIFNSRLELHKTEAAGLMLVAFPHIFLYDGRGADKPWLQEIPEPVSQIVWDSWAEIHPETARKLEVIEGDVVELGTENGALAVAAHITEHVQPDVIAVPIGQGHTSYGRYAKDRGVNPWPAMPPGWLATSVLARRSGRRHKLVTPIGLSTMSGRPIAEAVSLAQYRAKTPPAPFEELPPAPYEMYEPYLHPRHQWGMTIDLNACTGCSACVAACYAENNLAVVGPERVNEGRIMSWIRIERYFPEKPEAPPLHVIPMLCQQCGHAPCEPVCPVFAAVHNDEGLNAQVYNRCIGTRYCENNCPYKVRRFNFYKYRWDYPLNLQLNPDVTVRGAGVMEKCTFCVQRINSAEIAALDEGRPVRDGEIVPACAQACPARAITFGDINDSGSALMRRRAEHQRRAYRALEVLNTEPSIVYLSKVFRGPQVS